MTMISNEKKREFLSNFHSYVYTIHPYEYHSIFKNFHVLKRIPYIINMETSIEHHQMKKFVAGMLKHKGIAGFTFFIEPPIFWHVIFPWLVKYVLNNKNKKVKHISIAKGFDTYYFERIKEARC